MQVLKNKKINSNNSNDPLSLRQFTTEASIPNRTKSLFEKKRQLCRLKIQQSQVHNAATLGNLHVYCSKRSKEIYFLVLGLYDSQCEISFQKNNSGSFKKKVVKITTEAGLLCPKIKEVSKRMKPFRLFITTKIVLILAKLNPLDIPSRFSHDMKKKLSVSRSLN